MIYIYGSTPRKKRTENILKNWQKVERILKIKTLFLIRLG